MNNIELKKDWNELKKKSYSDSKLDYCLCCGKNVKSFCNSHSLPNFILKNISEDGYVLTSNNYFKMSAIDVEKGLKVSGTFRRICNKCDKEIFADYESPDKLLLIPREKIMTQIDLKNSLKMYDSKLNTIALYNNFKLKTFQKDYVNYFIRINQLDLDEAKNEVERDLKILSKSSSSSFELVFWEKLDYVVPIAFQGKIALVGDLNGDCINNIYNYNVDYILEYINICVFPLKAESIVMMFVCKDNKKYRNFINQFKKLSKGKKLRLISYIIFNYNEDFFISKSAKQEILDNKILDKVARNTVNIMASNKEYILQGEKKKFEELKNYINFPNILSKQYRINKKIK